MRARHADGDRPLVASQPDCQQMPKVYTPSIDGFERFVRESVGLDSVVPGDGQADDEGPREGRKTT